MASVDTEEILLLDYNLPPSTNQIVSIILEDRIAPPRLVYIASRGLDFLDIVKVCLDGARLNKHSIGGRFRILDPPLPTNPTIADFASV